MHGIIGNYLVGYIGLLKDKVVEKLFWGRRAKNM
jgi:hypothetical protein